MNLWNLVSIFFIQIALANPYSFPDKDHDEDYIFCKNNTYLDTRWDGAFRCQPCSTCPSGQYEREKVSSECQVEKVTTTAPPTTTNFERSQYCGYDMWYKRMWGVCLRCSKCNWDEYEYESCSNYRDTICDKCSNVSYSRNWDWQRKCLRENATTNAYNWRQMASTDANWRYSSWEHENRTPYNCSTPFENFELVGLLSCYFSTLIQWTFIVSLIIFSCCCLTAYKICTSCFRRERTLQQQIDKVRLLSPDELQVLQQATQMIKEQEEQKAKENNFENPNFQETV